MARRKPKIPTRQINVPIPKVTFARAKKRAIAASMFFKSWIARAIEQQIEREEAKAAQ